MGGRGKHLSRELLELSYALVSCCLRRKAVWQAGEASQGGARLAKRVAAGTGDLHQEAAESWPLASEVREKHADLGGRARALLCEAQRGEYQISASGIHSLNWVKSGTQKCVSHCQIKLSNETQTTASTVLSFTVIYHSYPCISPRSLRHQRSVFLGFWFFLGGRGSRGDSG